MIAIPIPSIGEVGVTLGNNFAYTRALTQITIVGVVVAPSVNDADLTLDINIAGSDNIEGIACAVMATPGTWRSTAIGGTQTPVTVAANSIISFDANDAAANTRLIGHILALVGEA